MAKPIIYLNGPISHVSIDEATLWRKYISARYGRAEGEYDFFDPTGLGTWSKQELSEAQHLIQEYHGAIDKSAGVITKMRRPSIGTSMSLYYAYIKGKPTVTICDSEFSAFTYHYSWIIVGDEDDAVEMMTYFVPSEGLQLSRPLKRPMGMDWSPEDLLALVREDCTASERTVRDILALQGEVLRDFYTELCGVEENRRTWDEEFRILRQVYKKYEFPIIRLSALHEEGQYEKEFIRRSLEQQLAGARQDVEKLQEEMKRLETENFNLRNRLKNVQPKPPNIKEPSKADRIRKQGFESICLVSAYKKDYEKLQLWIGDEDFDLNFEEVPYEEYESWMKRVHDKAWLGDLLLYNSENNRHFADFKPAINKKCKESFSALGINKLIEHLDKC